MKKRNYPKRMTMDDIAKKAGVSTATVSRTLNHPDLVHPDTREKVMEIIQQHEYVLNDLARSLKADDSRAVAIMVPDLSNSFFVELLLSAENYARKAGFATFLCNTDLDPEKESFYIHQLIKRRVSGLIIVGTEISDANLISLARKSLKIVAIQAVIDNCDYVDVDSYNGTREAVNYLAQCGHSKIAYLGYLFDLKPIKSRLEGYKSALKENSIPILDKYILDIPHTENVGYRGMEILFNLPDPPTAVQCMNDVIALGAYFYCNDHGIRIPHDISVSGFDFTKLSALMVPKLTTVRQPIEEMGNVAMQLLLEQIYGSTQRDHKNVTLPTSFVIGDSVKRC